MCKVRDDIWDDPLIQTLPVLIVFNFHQGRQACVVCRPWWSYSAMWRSTTSPSATPKISSITFNDDSQNLDNFHCAWYSDRIWVYNESDSITRLTCWWRRDLQSELICDCWEQKIALIAPQKFWPDWMNITETLQFPEGSLSCQHQHVRKASKKKMPNFRYGSSLQNYDNLSRFAGIRVMIWRRAGFGRVMNHF